MRTGALFLSFPSEVKLDSSFYQYIQIIFKLTSELLFCGKTFLKVYIYSKGMDTLENSKIMQILCICVILPIKMLSEETKLYSTGFSYAQHTHTHPPPSTSYLPLPHVTQAIPSIWCYNFVGFHVILLLYNNSLHNDLCHNSLHDVYMVLAVQSPLL